MGSFKLAENIFDNDTVQINYKTITYTSVCCSEFRYINGICSLSVTILS